MTTAGDLALSSGHELDRISALEWDCLCTRRHNVLLEGPEDSTDHLARLLQPYLRTPVLWRLLPASFGFPAGHSGALVLQNVGALARNEQADLFRWLGDGNERKQVVSTTARPLFPLVARGLFDEALYYRLNVMLLFLGPQDAPE